MMKHPAIKTLAVHEPETHAGFVDQRGQQSSQDVYTSRWALIPETLNVFGVLM